MIPTLRTASSLAALGALAALAGGSAPWPGFRGPGGSALSPEKDPPLKWSKSDGLRWKADLPGRGLSGPVVAGGRVFVTACSGYRQRRLHVLSFDEKTGRRLWERQFTATGSTACHSVSCMAAPTPAADDRAVYALFATGDLAALDHDGNLLWYRSLVGDRPGITNQIGMAASPALAGTVLLLPLENAGDSFAAGLDTATGKDRWTARRPRGINWVSPIVFPHEGRTAALFQTETEATAYDARTGEVLWSYADKGLSSIKSPSVGEGLIFLAADKVLAIRPRRDGNPHEEVWRAGDLSQGYASPIYYRGWVYYLTPVALVCMRASDGEEQWRQRVAGPFDASPVIAGGRLYAVNNRGRTTVVALGERPRVLARNDLDDAIQATPALADRCLYFRSDKALYCAGPKK
jgi:outer membrane protein assembly factor BamB